jgi:hypothetical protein
LNANSERLQLALCPSYCHGMASNKAELSALKNLLSQTDRILSTTDLPQNRTDRCRELLHSAIAITDDLLKQTELAAAAILGRKGGTVIAKTWQRLFPQASSPS